MVDRLGPFLLGPNDTPENGIYTGDARELAKAIPDESVDLIFTDPVYQNIDDYRWLAEMAARVLKIHGDVLVYAGAYHLAPVMAAMSASLSYRWILTEKKLTSGALIWSYRLFSHVIPILWFTKGLPRMKGSRIDFMWSQGEGSGVNHPWAKGARRIARWLNRFGEHPDIVFDPFVGGGATVAACKMLGRRYLAFEILSDVAETARERVRMTQMPLFVLEPKQSEMTLGGDCG